MRETPTEVLARLGKEDPARVALEWGTRTVTYGDLEHDVDRLAGFLADAVAASDTDCVAPRIGVRATELPAMVTALLAVGRCGLVCVPLDPTSPLPRTAAVLADVAAALVLSDDPAQLADLDTLGSTRVISIATAIDGGRPFGTPAQVRDDDIVSIIFTSGSSGSPKGVMSSRRLLVESMHRNRSVSLTPGRRRFGVPIVGTLGSFERMILSAAIGDGATIVGYDVRACGVQPLADWLRAQRIEHFAIVPTLLRALLETLSAGEFFVRLRTVFTWGEPVAWSDAERLLRHLPPEARLLVTYRSTEASGITCATITTETEIGTGIVPAGQPMPGVELRIVDDAGADVGLGVEGHVVVAHGDIASGYWHLPDLSAEVFQVGIDGARSCRTGDLGKLRADGQLVVTGRADQMVKVSGNRVDLGEIECVLRQIAGICEAAVVARPDEAGDLRLAAFVTAAGAVESAAVRSRLRALLPGYMVPDSIDVLSELPKLSNGKLARGALRTRPPAGRAAVDDDDAPRDDLERALATIWRKVLGVPVGRHDRFVDLGGDSMRAARMFARVQQQLGYDRPVSLLLTAPTIAEIATSLRDADGDAAWSPLVMVRAGADRQPLFVIHGAGGDVMFAALMASHLDQARPVYGLRPSVLSGRPLREQTVEGLAATYLSAMRTVQPRGPYALFGYSLGARIGFEIARQLRVAGAEVSLLALGDAPAPGFDINAALPSMATRWRRRIAEQRAAGAPTSRVFRTLTYRLVRRSVRRWHQYASGAASTRRIDALVRRGEAVPPALRNDFSVSQLRVLSRRYAPDAALDVPVLLIRTDQVPDVPDLGWTALAPRLRIEHIGCAHLDLVREPYVEALAAVLERHLSMDEADSSEGRRRMLRTGSGA